MVGSSDVTESYTEHNVRPPVIPPNIFLDPRLILDTDLVVPTLFRVDIRHQVQKYGQDMSNSKVKNEHFQQPIILLSFGLGDVEILKLLKTL